MYVSEHGPPEGDAVVFLHGSMVAGWMWTEQVAALSETHRTIVPDLPGLGASGAEPWTSFAGAAETVGDDLAVRTPRGAHVVGLSLGGIVALNLAIVRPELCKSLLVSGVPAQRVAGTLRLVNRLMASVYGTSVGARMIGRVFGMPDDESMDAFVATANATDPSAIKAIVDEVASQPLPDQLGAIRVPVLAVVGDKDTSLARAAVPVLMDRVPNARGARVPGVGHQWNAEAPELFTDMVRVWIEQSEIHPGLRPITA